MSTADWTAIAACATAAMAIATFLLALKTRTVAAETRQVAKATQAEAAAVEKQTAHVEEQIQISADALRSSIQPWLTVDVDHLEQAGAGPFQWMDMACTIADLKDAQGVGVTLRVVNVGPGLALIQSELSHVVGYGQVNSPDELRPFTYVFTNVPVIPPATGATLEAEVRRTSAEWIDIDRDKLTRTSRMTSIAGGKGDFQFEIAYTDAGGKNLTYARFKVVVDEKFSCRVFEIDYRDATDALPHASVRVGVPR
jgi:hypothetical protein